MRILIISTLLFFNTVQSMSDELDKKILEKVDRFVGSKQKNLDFSLIPTGLNVDVLDRVLEWNEVTQEVSTYYGERWKLSNNEWEKIRDGEYSDQAEFLKSIYEFHNYSKIFVNYNNIATCIERNLFPLCAYHKETNTLMYAAHENSRYGRSQSATCLADGVQNKLTDRIVFERDGKKWQEYDPQISNNQFLWGVGDGKGEYYAVAGRHHHVKEEESYFDFTIILMRVLESALQTKLFTEIMPSAVLDNVHYYKFRGIYNGYFKNNHFNATAWIVDSKEESTKQLIISPVYDRISDYECAVVCGTHNYAPYSFLRHFSALKKKIEASKPRVHVTDSRITAMIYGWEKLGLVRDLRQKILYDLSYVSEKFRSAITFIYGIDIPEYSMQERKALKLLYRLKKYIHDRYQFNLGKCTYDEWLKHLPDVIDRFLIHYDHKYTQKSLWKVMRVMKNWDERSTTLLFGTKLSSLLLEYLFKQCRLPQFVIHKYPADEIIIEPEGGIIINYSRFMSQAFYRKLRDDLWQYYIKGEHKKRAKWGTKADVQRFINGNCVEKIITGSSDSDTDYHFVRFVLRNESHIVIMKTHQGWEVINGSGGIIGTYRYYVSKHDTRTQEEIAKEMALLSKQ